MRQERAAQALDVGHCDTSIHSTPWYSSAVLLNIPQDCREHMTCYQTPSYKHALSAGLTLLDLDAMLEILSPS